MQDMIVMHLPLLRAGVGRLSAPTLTDHPTIAAAARNYSIVRSELAKANGLGKKVAA